MILLNLFLSKKQFTANIAKKRLKILVQMQRNNSEEFNCFLNLKNDLLLAIQKYIKIKSHLVSIKIEKTRKKKMILELRIPVTIQ
ncbi:cell division topological specificity factor MinE [Buchnera aphidicola]|uniref:cell division topological specificity factor MinE n=1 Tax=Buchnera aphidicola TaxID=9 RepID=UPI00094DB0AB|nr:cell division topological specificity factor MinE [Buchnera aphidicola]